MKIGVISDTHDQVDHILKLTLDKRNIFVYHGDYEEETEALVSYGKYDAVFHGHTHASVNK